MKVLPGRVIFNNANTYRGGTIVAAGSLNIRDSRGLGQQFNTLPPPARSRTSNARSAPALNSKSIRGSMAPPSGPTTATSASTRSWERDQGKRSRLAASPDLHPLLQGGDDRAAIGCRHGGADRERTQLTQYHHCRWRLGQCDSSGERIFRVVFNGVATGNQPLYRGHGQEWDLRWWWTRFIAYRSPERSAGGGNSAPTMRGLAASAASTPTPASSGCRDAATPRVRLHRPSIATAARPTIFQRRLLHLLQRRPDGRPQDITSTLLSIPPPSTLIKVARGISSSRPRTLTPIGPRFNRAGSQAENDRSLGTMNPDQPVTIRPYTTISEGTALHLKPLASAATANLVHDYDLNGSLADNLGGPDISSNGGTTHCLGLHVRRWTRPEPLERAGQTPATTDLDELPPRLPRWSGGRWLGRLLEFKGLQSDFGLYSVGGFLTFYDGGVCASSSTAVIAAGTDYNLLFTRNGTTKEVGRLHQWRRAIPLHRQHGCGRLLRARERHQLLQRQHHYDLSRRAGQRGREQDPCLRWPARAAAPNST